MGVVAFGAYVLGLALAGMSTFLAMAIGPFDAFAAAMIAVPGAIGLVGGAGIVRAVGRPRRRLAVFALILGVAWVAATVWVVSLFATIGR